MLGPKWQLPNEDAAPALVHLYYIIDLVILAIGIVIYTRTLFMWRVAFQRVGSALQSYAWIALGDASEWSELWYIRHCKDQRMVTSCPAVL
jgi:hypothetical protein